MNTYQHRRRYALASLVTVMFTIIESVNHSNRDVASTFLLFATASFLPLTIGQLLDIIAEERHGTK